VSAPGYRNSGGPYRPRLSVVEGGAARAAPAAPVGARPREAPVSTRPGARDTALLLGAVALLSVVGLAAVLAASGVAAAAQGGSVFGTFLRQCVWVALGLAAAVVASRLPMRFWRRTRGLLLAATVVLLFAVFVPGPAELAGGATRWVGYGPIQVQPSELAKFALVVYAADLCARRRAEGRASRLVGPLLVVYAVLGGLVLLQPDMGTAIVLFCIVLAVLLGAGVRARVVGGLLLLGAAGGAVVALVAPYRRARLLSFVNPFAHASGSGYQVVQSLVAVAAGGVAGTGLGRSPAVWGYLPNAHTDFVYAVLAAGLGVVGGVVVLGAFAVLGVAGLRIAGRAPDEFSRLLACGVTCWLMSEAVINIGGVLGVLPVTGIPLPFVSFGGSSLVVAFVGVGVLVRVARDARGRAPARPSGRAIGGRSAVADVATAAVRGRVGRAGVAR
jgi:cell division protein FtsW